MKRVGRLIDSELRSQKITARQMAEKMRLDPALLSRIRSGQARDIGTRRLLLMQKGISPDATVQARFLAAYLADKIEGNPLADRVAIGVADDGESPKRREAVGGKGSQSIEKYCEDRGLDRRTAAAIGLLIELIPTNRRLRNLVISLAGYARGK